MNTADAIFMFVGVMGITTIWLFRRDWLIQSAPRRILYIISGSVAFIGIAGIAKLYNGVHTYLHWLIFPICVLVYHDALIGLFKKMKHRLPIDTTFSSQGETADRLFNVVFALFSMLVPVIVGAYLAKTII